jgi:type VI secretion system secreted protein Hcp
MAFDAFLKISTIRGEGGEDMHKGWIELLSYSHGIDQPKLAPSSGAWMPADHIESHDFTITKLVDHASPKLTAAYATGERFSEVNVEICLAGGDKQKYMEYKLTDVTIASVRPGEHASDSEAPQTEVVTFSYAEFEIIRAQTDKATGKAVGQLPPRHDLKANKQP